MSFIALYGPLPSGGDGDVPFTIPLDAILTAYPQAHDSYFNAAQDVWCAGGLNQVAQRVECAPRWVRPRVVEQPVYLVSVGVPYVPPSLPVAVTPEPRESLIVFPLLVVMFALGWVAKGQWRR